jgi:hypothetical protein
MLATQDPSLLRIQLQMTVGLVSLQIKQVGRGEKNNNKRLVFIEKQPTTAKTDGVKSF